MDFIRFFRKFQYLLVLGPVILLPVVVHASQHKLDQPDTIQVTITANRLKFEPDTITAKPEQPIIVVMKNKGYVSHSFDVLKRGESLTAQDDSAYIKRTHSVQPDSFVRTTFNIDEPGEYTFVCDVASHVKAGMKGKLYIKE